MQQTATSWGQCEKEININYTCLISSPFDNESCYLVDSSSVYRFNLATCKGTPLPELPRRYNHYRAGIVVYKNQLTVFQHKQVMTLENQRWIIKRYEPMSGLMQVMIYKGEIHACVEDGEDYEI